MAEYQANSTSQLNFDITKGDVLIGKLIYKSWFKFNATIELANNKSYEIEPKGFWGTTIEVKESDNVLMKFKMNWKGEILIQLISNHIEKGFLFKHRGIFKESFLLADDQASELLVMKPHIKWNKMNYQYTLTTSDSFESFDAKELLLIASLHCANYYMAIMTTSGIGA